MRHAGVIGALIAASLFVYAPVTSYEFLSFDDGMYVSENHVVLEGLSARGVLAAITDHTIAMWTPITTLSYQLDIELFGPDSGAFHRTNLLIHILNAVLLYVMILVLTSAVWPSALVALLFAVHPLHVESVAWISERKDVVSTFFWFSATIAYARYVIGENRSAYLVMVLLFILGLLSKPMLVTFPFALLLLDRWPLGRLSTLPDLKARLLEKAPLFAITAVFLIPTFGAQSSHGARISVGSTALPWVLGNVFDAYGMYLWRTVAPFDLSVYYPRPLELPPAPKLAAMVGGMLLATAGALATWKKKPYLAVGWFWFVGTLIPVIGFVQIGWAARADRYTYVPHVGLFIAFAFLLAHFVRGRPQIVRGSVLAALGIALTLLTIRARDQVTYWQNSETLFTHALDVQPDNYMAHTHLGIALVDDHAARGIRHFESAVALSPFKVQALTHLAVAHTRAGDMEGARRAYEEAIATEPTYSTALIGLGRIYLDEGNREQATLWMRRAATIGVDDPMEYFDLGRMEGMNGNFDLAIQHYRSCLSLDPNLPQAHINLGSILGRIGHMQEAKREFEIALALAPEDAGARAGMDLVLRALKNSGEPLSQDSNSFTLE